MRLIDADKVRIELVYFTCPTGIDEAPYDFGSDIIDKEPTVEAIPIEWIKKKCTEADDNGMGIDDWSEKDCYEYVLKEWEKENENIRV